MDIKKREKEIYLLDIKRRSIEFLISYKRMSAMVKGEIRKTRLLYQGKKQQYQTLEHDVQGRKLYAYRIFKMQNKSRKTVLNSTEKLKLLPKSIDYL